MKMEFWRVAKEGVKKGIGKAVGKGELKYEKKKADKKIKKEIQYAHDKKEAKEKGIATKDKTKKQNIA